MKLSEMLGELKPGYLFTFVPSCAYLASAAEKAKSHLRCMSFPHAAGIAGGLPRATSAYAASLAACRTVTLCPWLRLCMLYNRVFTYFDTNF